MLTILDIIRYTKKPLSNLKNLFMSGKPKNKKKLMNLPQILKRHKLLLRNLRLMRKLQPMLKLLWIRKLQ
jgi:hypothetical protein